MDNNAKHRNGDLKSFIIQKYIERPLLYQRRKFDIRCFMLLTSINGYLKAYFYEEGYVRTSSNEYNCRNFNRMVHLTNDAIQCKSENYGKYESGNKVSFQELDKYLNSFCKLKLSVSNDILPNMKYIA